MRRIWIVHEGTEITKEVVEQAELNGCSEVVRGIPPKLVGKVVTIPAVYEEPEAVLEEVVTIKELLSMVKDLCEKIGSLEVRVEALEKR